jgi:hypothetical protein
MTDGGQDELEVSGDAASGFCLVRGGPFNADGTGAATICMTRAESRWLYDQLALVYAPQESPEGGVGE